MLRWLRALFPACASVDMTDHFAEHSSLLSGEERAGVAERRAVTPLDFLFSGSEWPEGWTCLRDLCPPRGPCGPLASSSQRLYTEQPHGRLSICCQGSRVLRLGHHLPLRGPTEGNDSPPAFWLQLREVPKSGWHQMLTQTLPGLPIQMRH